MYALRLALLLACALLLPTEVQAQESDPVLYRQNGMEQVTIRENLSYKTAGNRSLMADFFYPADHQDNRPAPAVIFFNGGDSGALRNKENGPLRFLGPAGCVLRNDRSYL